MSDEDQETSSAAIQPTPPELLIKRPLDFAATIARLEQRAVGARKRARWAGVILLIVVYCVVTVLIYNLLRGNESSRFDLYTFSSYESRQTIERPLARRVAHIVNQLVGPEKGAAADTSKFLPPDKEAATHLKGELKEALVDLEKAVQIADIGKKADSATSQIAPVVSTAVFSLGSIGVLILMIQISVMFIRYHLRLGELYDAQSDALRASGGDSALAYALLQYLSPNTIEVGQSPTSLYEKALGAIQAVAKR